MPHRLAVILFPILLLLSLPAFAQAPPATNGFNLSWSALDPGDDWAAQVIESVFPVSGNPPPTATGSEATVIGQMVGQLTGFVMAIAMAFVCYLTIMNIHRVAETARLLSTGMTSMFLVRVGFAAIMMFPQSNGFSVGQSAIIQGALWGIGMARTVYTNAVQAVGPDAMVIAQPMIPGTKTIVANLMQNELCRALVNAASGNPNLVPEPTPVQVQNVDNSGTITWSYSLSPGNQTGSPVCGTVQIREPNQGSTNIAGVNVDMMGQQQTILTNVLQNDILPTIQTVATNLWQTKQASALSPLQGVFQTATADYTNQLTAAATTITASLRAGLLSNTATARSGGLGLAQNQTQLSSLGWSSAGAYYLEFARLNGQTLSLLTATPTVTQPSYEGLGPALSTDLAPLIQASQAFLTRLDTYVTTTDGLSTPGGNADLFSGATPGGDGAGVLDQLARRLHVSDWVLQALQSAMSPSGTLWTDPFGGLMRLGNQMILIALTILGSAALLSSTTGTAAATLFNLLSGNAAAAGMSVVGHFLVNFLATPIFLGVAGLLIPGLTIAFVLPTIPWVMWMAGVAGWIILVCEAFIAVPLWMLAHMTFEGPGLHGNATEGYSLLFNVLFRPVLMLFGLFLGYFVFAAMSWLIQQSFGIAAGFVLANGWLVTNMIGLTVLLGIFVLTHVVSALISFRLISLVPHHLPRLIGFMAANRVDMDQFSRDAALVGVRGTVLATNDALLSPLRSAASSGNALSSPPRYLPGPNTGTASAGNAGMDSTLRAVTDVPPPPAEFDEA